jgi:hypothetical protein
MGCFLPSEGKRPISVTSVIRPYVESGTSPADAIHTDPPPRASPPEAGRIIARPILGGLQHENEWVAAQGKEGG